MSCRFRTRAIVIIFAFICATGCTNGNEVMTPSVSNPKPTVNTPVPSTVPVIDLTLDNFKSMVKAGLTQEQMESSFGRNYKSADTSIVSNTGWDKAESWSRSFTPGFGALKASSSDQNEIARTAGISLGDTFKAPRAASGYDMLTSPYPKMIYLGRPGVKLTVTAMNDTFAEVDDAGVRVWMPVWYLTAEAGNAAEIQPRRMVAAADAKAAWDPKTGDTAVTVAKGKTVYAIEEYGDWLGVAVPTAGELPGFGLLWMKKEALQETDPWKPVYRGSESDPADDAAAVVRSVLQIGVSRARVEALFGLPAFTEASGNTAMPPHLHTLPVSRYESDASELSVTWGDDGKLIQFQFRDKNGRYDFGGGVLSSGDLPVILGPLMREPTLRRPVVRSEKVSYDWRTHTDLPYNYLIGTAGKKVLLVAGEDGGFSGLHESSQLYGIDRETGKRIWTHDFGHEQHVFALSGDGERIVCGELIGNSTDLESKYRLQAFDTATGKRLWSTEHRVDGAIGYPSLEASGRVAAFSYTLYRNGTPTVYLEAWDIRTGRKLWTKSKAGEGMLVSGYNDQSLFMVKYGVTDNQPSELTAYRSSDGSVVWNLKDRAVGNVFQPLMRQDLRKLNGPTAGFWTGSVDQIFRTDIRTGKSLDTYSAAGALFEKAGDRYLLKKVSSGGELGTPQEWHTYLINGTNGEVQWVVNNKIQEPVVEDGILFCKQDGKPAAFRVSDGTAIWTSDWSAQGRMTVFADKLLVEAMPDVYIVDKKTGQLQARLADVQTGYYDITPDIQAYGTITVVDGKLYMGSSNGYFARLSKLP